MERRYRKGAALIMLWYAIQSYTGKEEQLAEMIRRMVPDRLFGECFVPYFERLRNWRQQNQIHILRLFPGYLFISTDRIEEVFQCMKKVPAMSKVLTAGEFEFTPLYENEVEFLGRILDADHIVRLTYAATDGKGHVTYMAGPLERCSDRVQAYKFRDRYAKVALTIAGQEKTARMGILLNNDVRRELAYGKVEAHIAAPEKYTIADVGRETQVACLQKNTRQGNPSHGNPSEASPAFRNSDRTSSDACMRGNGSRSSMTSSPYGRITSAALLKPGDRVAVISGAFEGIVTEIHEVRNNIISIIVHLFDREIPVEVSVEDVRKLEAAG